MLPEINSITVVSSNLPSYTYNINRDTNRISGFIDNRDAVVQAIYLILQTERYESLIYNWYYGIELDNLIGKDRNYFNSEIKRVIREALLEDDRIIDITSFSISYEEDKVIIEFKVNSNVGDIDIDWEVNI